MGCNASLESDRNTTEDTKPSQQNDHKEASDSSEQDDHNPEQNDHKHQSPSAQRNNCKHEMNSTSQKKNVNKKKKKPTGKSRGVLNPYRKSSNLKRGHNPYGL